MSIYTENSYIDRQDYLNVLAEEYDIDITIVESLADILGEEEDFDGLVTSLMDFSEGF